MKGRALAATVGAGLLALTACGPLPSDTTSDDAPTAPGTRAPQAAPPDGATFTKVEEPPPTPPPVEIHGEEVEPGYYEWRIEGEEVTHRAAETQDEVPLPEIALDGTSDLRLDIGTQVKPADFVVVTFDEVDEQGVPVDPEGEQHDCLSDRSRCNLAPDDGGTSARLEMDDTPEVVVVHLAYVAEDPASGSVDLYTGSWGARLTDDTSDHTPDHSPPGEESHGPE